MRGKTNKAPYGIERRVPCHSTNMDSVSQERKYGPCIMLILYK
jgi:hypothetical protein